MDFSLYDESVGYYGSGKAAIGRDGDFYTSVSVGALFGQLLALQAAEVWQKLGRPGKFSIVEQGGHDACLAEDVLRAIDASDSGFAQCVRYTVCDAFPGKRATTDSRIQRCGKLEELPQGAAAMFLCNELLDAFPVHRIRYRPDGWKEIWVISREGELVVEERVPSATLTAAIMDRIPQDYPFSDGYTTEICLEVESWMKGAAATIGRGVLIAIDYGFFADDYYVPERTDGTLRCYSGHRVVDNPLLAPGESDMTAHVDWTAVQAAGEQVRLEPIGFADQGAYLTRLAAPLLLASEQGTTSGAEIDRKWIRQFQTLTHPGLLGRSFGVMAFAKGVESQGWNGFQHS